jgi:hypothetical protein
MTTTDPATDTAHPPGRRRRLSPAWLAAAAVLVVTLLAGGALAVRNLTDDDPAPTPSASPSVTPSASSPSSPSPTPQTEEEKAAAEAQTAYREYIRVVDQVGQDGGRDPDRLKVVALGEELLAQEYAASQYRVKQWHQVGVTTVVGLEVMKISLTTDPKTFAVPEVVLRSCIDVSEAYAVDKEGKIVRPATAPTHYRWTLTVRKYPDRGGVSGWFVAKAAGSGVSSC